MNSSSRNRTLRSDYRRSEHEEAEAGPPVDLSFKKATTIDELESVPASRSARTGKVPERTANNRFLTSTLWLSNNGLTSTSRLQVLVNNLLDSPPSLAWLDLSFNDISDIGPEITNFPNLKILYLHGNNVSNMSSIVELRKLPKLRSLTLHGNPIESVPFYRQYVLCILPQLFNLDFSPVTTAERRKAPPAGFHKMINLPVDSKPDVSTRI